MELIKRIWRVILANLNSLVNNAEEPEKILEQAFLEIQGNLVDLRQATAQAIAIQKRTERQAQTAQAQADDWKTQAKLALQAGNETLAREALTKRKAYQENATNLNNQIQQQTAVVAKLKEDTRSLELKINELKTKKDMYIARARSAAANVRLQEMLTGTGASGSLSAFDRMEEQVLQTEAQAEAIAALGTDDLQKRFDSLGAASDIENELAALKTQVLHQNQLPKTSKS